MTVRELILRLMEYDPNTEVKIFDGMGDIYVDNVFKREPRQFDNQETTVISAW